MFKKEIIGLMSGTSLDGLDIAHVEFVIENTKTRYFLKSSQTIPYPDSLHEKLQSAHSLDISELTNFRQNYRCIFCRTGQFVYLE